MHACSTVYVPQHRIEICRTRRCFFNQIHMPQFPVFNRKGTQLVFLLHPHQGPMWRVFRDDLLYSIVVRHGYLSYCHLPARLNQSGHSPLNCLLNKAFLPTDLLLTFFFFSHHSLYILATVVHENARRLEEIHKQSCLAPTIIPRSKSFRSHFIPILLFGLNNNSTSWPRLHAPLHWAAATWLSD